MSEYPRPRGVIGGSIPSLDALGDQLEAAAARSIGGHRPERSPSGRVRPRVLVPALAFFLAVVVVASVVLAASRSGSGTADAEVVSAMKRSSAMSTGHFRLTVSLPAPDGTTPPGNPTELRADGVFDDNTGTMHADLDASAMLAGLAPGAASGIGTGEMVVDRGTVYVSISGSGSWFRLGEATSPSGSSTPVASPPSPGDPSGLLDLFGGITDVERIGPQDIGGTPTTHYRGSVDLSRAFADLAPDDSRRLAGSLGLVGGGMPRSGRMPVDIWVDGSGMVRRIDSSLDVGSLGLGSLSLGSLGVGPSGSGAADPTSTGAAAASTIARFSAEFSDLGAPLSVTVPDPASVAAFPALPGTTEPAPTRPR